MAEDHDWFVMLEQMQLKGFLPRLIGPDLHNLPHFLCRIPPCNPFRILFPSSNKHVELQFPWGTSTLCRWTPHTPLMVPSSSGMRRTLTDLLWLGLGVKAKLLAEYPSLAAVEWKILP
jgi:hypothetical protein